jgi:hypothetical protein
LAYMILSRMKEKQGKHNPEQQTAGDNPYKQITLLLIDFLFFYDSHMNSTLLDIFSADLEIKKWAGS